MMQRPGPSCLFIFSILVSALSATPVQAEGETPHEELYQLLKIDPELQPYSSDLFGDRIDMATGSLSFEHVDVSLRGSSSLPVEIRRSFTVGGMNGMPHRPGMMGDWTLEIPRVRTIVPGRPFDGSSIGVEPHWSDLRCNELGNKPDQGTAENSSSTFFMPEEFWHGYFIDIPGQGSGEILRKATTNGIPTPGYKKGAGGDYIWTTTSGTMIRCLSDITTDGALNPNVNPSGHALGQGFQALTPDGTLYTFDRLIYRHAGWLYKENEHGADVPMERYSAEMQVSRIEDRFGNWVEYEYDGDNRPVRVSSNDGREIVIHYNSKGLLDRVTVGDRQWTYNYIDHSPYGGATVPILDSIVRPDATAWQFDMTGLAFVKLQMVELDGTGVYADCGTPDTPITGAGVGSMTHPLGAVAAFTVAPKRHNRTNVDIYCANPNNLLWSPFTHTVSITGKQISGPGIATMNWIYQYSEQLTPYATTQDTPATTEKWVDVKTPENSVVRHYSSMNFDWSENTPTRTVYFEKGVDPSGNSYSAGDVLREVVFERTSGAQLGISPHSRKNNASIVFSPRMTEQTVREGTGSYTREVLSYDVYGNPTLERNFSSTNAKTKWIGRTYLADTHRYSVSHLTKLRIAASQSGATSGTTTVATEYVRDTSERIIAIKNWDETVATYTYANEGGVNSLLASYTDGLGKTTTFSGYTLGIPGTVAYPDGSTKAFSVDAHGQIISVTDQRGSTTKYDYDPMGRVTLIDYPDNDTVDWTSTTYDFRPFTAGFGLPYGHHRRLITTGTHEVHLYFDVLLRPVLTVDHDKETDEYRFTHKAFDSENRLTFASYPSSSATVNTGTRSQYDALGRLVSQVADSEHGDLATTFSYANGNRRTVTDPLYNTTAYTYEAYASPDYSLPRRIEAPEGQLTVIDYDLYGNMIRATQSGPALSVQRDYIYDSHKRLCRRVDPETGNSIWQYDAAGRVDWYAEGIAGTLSGCGHASVPLASQRDLQYDNMGRVIADNVPGTGDDIAYGYDAAGNLVSVQNGEAAWTYAYNRRNLVTSEVLAIDAETVAFSHEYNPRGQLSRTVYPSGREVDFAPNAYGEPTRVASLVGGIEYHPNGMPASWIYANGVRYTSTLNARTLPSGILHAGTVGYGYTYDANANIKSITDLDVAGGAMVNSVANIQYDGLNRLVQADGTLWGRASYDYDALGNLIYKGFDNLGVSRLMPPREQVYEYDATHRLTGILDGTGTGTYTHQFTYDDKGNIVSTGSDGYLFDSANRMTQATGKASYRYDGHGRRVKITESGTGNVRYMAYTQDGLLRYEHDAASGEKTEYYYRGRTLVGKASGAPRVPLVPTLTVDVHPNDGDFNLAWSGSDADTFILEESAPGASGWTTLLDQSTATTYGITGRSGGPWTYRVRGCNAEEGCSLDGRLIDVGVTPTLPAITVPVGTQDGAYTVSWTKPSFTSEFILQVNDGAGWVTVSSGSVATSTVRPQAGGSFQYQVLASNEYGDRGYVTSGTVNVVPPPPTLISTNEGTSLDGYYTIGWAASPGAQSYELRRRVNGGAWSTIYSGAALSYAENVTTAALYDYAVRACNAHGCTGSWRGNATVTVQVPAVPGTPSYSDSPRGGSIDGAYTVDWGNVSGATSYRLYRKLNGGGYGLAYNGGNSYYNDAGRADGNWYYYVRACSRIGCSGNSGVRKAFVEHTPSVPTGMDSPMESSSKIFYVEWNAVSPVNTYEVYWRWGSNDFAPIKTGLTVTRTSVNMVYNGTHDFRVRACRTLSCSGFSNTTSTFVFEGGGGGCTSSADSGEPVLQSGSGEPTTDGTTDGAATLDSGTTAAPIPPGC